MDLAAFSQASAAGAHDPLRDCGMNSIRLTAATVVFGTNATPAIARMAVVLMALAFDSGRRNGQPWLRLNDRHARFRPSLFSLDQQVPHLAAISLDDGNRLLKAKPPQGHLR